jgi:hypothetical protein
VHRDILDEFRERRAAGDEIRLAVQLDQRADLAPGMDVRTDRSLVGDALGLLCSARLPELAQLALGAVGL